MELEGYEVRPCLHGTAVFELLHCLNIFTVDTYVTRSTRTGPWTDRATT